ncbi:Iris-A [Operophtera brumata]|uniref:Iris-A n=1 Tax=Operophtera brumata TaxID=104452 RepID=A0A0L7LB13_OPEBR|nr:Iris-A [Operophtera brumata]
MKISLSIEPFPLPLRMKQEQAEITKYVYVSSKYIAVNFRKNTYISLNEEGMKQCIQQRTDNFVCSLNLPIRNLESTDAPCEAKLLGHQKTSPCISKKTECVATWIELYSSNTWLAVCCDSCVVRTVCAGEVASHQLNTSGLITLKQGCVMQNKDLSIYAHNLFHSDARVNLYLAKPPKLVKSINHIFNSQRTPQLRRVSEDENLEKVARQLEQQKINELQLPATISTHDIHQYTICYTLLAVVVIAALVRVIRKRGLCNTKATYATAAEHPEPEAIKLQSKARSPTQCDTTTSNQTRKLGRSSSLVERPRKDESRAAATAQRERAQPRREPVQDVDFNFN